MIITIIFGEGVIFDKKVTEINQVFKGCYVEEDPVSKPDLAGYSMLLKEPDPEQCCLVCRKKGWPFCGLFKAYQCHCGFSYGSNGPSLDCNQPQCLSLVCGGPEANSVYYSLPKRFTERSQNLMFFPEKLTFKKARMKCLVNDGELASPINKQVIDSLADIINKQSQNNTKVWLGLHKPQNAMALEWTEELLQLSYSTAETDLHKYWSGEKNKDCVVMLNDKWLSTDCDEQHPFICNIHNRPSILNNETKKFINKTFTAINTTKERTTPSSPFSDTKNLMAFILIPAILMCYLGSCVIYCFCKIKQNCSEKTMISRVSNFFEEERINRMYNSYKQPSINFREKSNEYAAKNKSTEKSINKILIDKLRAKRAQDAKMLM